MSIGNTTEQNLMLLLFNATAIANIADNAASSPITNTQAALHTADPGEAGTQATSEVGYTNYARTAVARSGSGWTVSGGVATAAADITFPAGAGGSGTVTHFSIGKTASGSTDLFFSGTVTPNVVTGTGVTPKLSTSTTCSLD